MPELGLIRARVNTRRLTYFVELEIRMHGSDYWKVSERDERRI